MNIAQITQEIIIIVKQPENNVKYSRFKKQILNPENRIKLPIVMCTYKINPAKNIYLQGFNHVN